MGTGHDHANLGKSNERALTIALILTSTFLIAEAIGGFITGSLALISDAAHMLTDVTALTIALIAIKIGRRPADSSRTFGYFRFEVLAAAINTILLFVVAIYIIFEAYQRLQSPPEINSTGMLIIASIGLIVNIISMRILAPTKDKSLNMKGAYLEVWSDMLGSIGVITGAIIIRYTGLTWVDSLIAVLIGLWVLPRTWILLKASVNILLEGVPEGIELEKLKESILSIDGVLDIHELHIWAITNDKVSLTAHVIIDEKKDCENLLNIIRKQLTTQFGISHTTLQHERKKCIDDKNTCNLHTSEK
ncbi:MAG: cation diffusion facilitator family transporter [Legionellales bacterium]|jgi:cobalt-zinc-cadmium efflux system protein